MDIQETFSILLVDDDRTVIRILSHILSGIEPLRFATSGHMALKLARESVPDLVLLDVEMPELGGLEVCKQFKSDPALAQVPIIFLTSHDSPQLATAGLELGAVDFISKPPHASLVLARVHTYQRLKMLSDTLRSTATMDFLTGAVTRSQLERALTVEWLRAQRSAAPLSLLLLDIDRFPACNAESDEKSGDACLKGVADALRSVGCRSSDVLGRYARGTFALLLPETGTDGASSVAQRAIDGVDGLRIRHAPTTGEGHITLSVGGVCLDCSLASAMAPGASDETMLADARIDVVASPDDLIDAAERALKAARAAGGHQARLVGIASSATRIRYMYEDRRSGVPESANTAHVP